MKPRTRQLILMLCAAFTVLTSIEALLRFDTFHNRTYDLALYARQAWGLAHGDLWDPIISVSFFGTHLSVPLLPLGLLGTWLGTVPVLLFAQSLTIGMAALPLANIAARRFSDAGALTATFCYLLYPNLGHVASYEFHPGSLGMLPLAVALDAIDSPRPRRLLVSCIALMACRADFAMLTCLIGACALFWQPELRRAGAWALGLSCVYLGVQFLVLRRLFWPTHGSLDLHFGPWGGSPFGVLRALVKTPAVVFAHFTAPARLSYLPRLLLPLALLPCFAPRWLILTLPFLAINLISVFPTTTFLYSHYLTPAVPTLVAAAMIGLHQLTRLPLVQRWVHLGPWAFARAGLLVCIGCTIVASVIAGGLPWSRDFEVAAFSPDAYSVAASRILTAVPAYASVQAPDPLLPHLIERHALHRAPPPDQDADYVMLDISHRQRYAHTESLLRTLEEPVTRTWLARRDYGIEQLEPPFLLLKRGNDPRGGLAQRYLQSFPGRRSAQPLCKCLWLLSAWLSPNGLELELFSHAPCPNDLAIRLGAGPKPARVDLLFDGVLSPVHLRDEYLMSRHPLTDRERADILKRGLYIGALRSSGAQPDPDDPVSVPVQLIH